MPVAVIPFRPVDPKTAPLERSSPAAEREVFARAMLADVVAAVRGGRARPPVLSTHPFESADAEVRVAAGDSRARSTPCSRPSKAPVLVIMADLPLVTTETVRRLVGTAADVAIAPGRAAARTRSTSAITARFHVDYYEISVSKHLAIAAAAGLSTELVDSFRLYLDLDEEADLVDLLIHGDGPARACLESLGIVLSVTRGRVCLERRPRVRRARAPWPSGR